MSLFATILATVIIGVIASHRADQHSLSDDEHQTEEEAEESHQNISQRNVVEEIYSCCLNHCRSVVIVTVKQKRVFHEALEGEELRQSDPAMLDSLSITIYQGKALVVIMLVAFQQTRKQKEPWR